MNNNRVTVTFDAAVPFPDLRIAEYSGLAASKPVDAAAGATGVGTLSGAAVTTTTAIDLLVGANYVTTATTAPGSGYASRILTSPDGSILEDGISTSAGRYFASSPIAPSGAWIMQLVAFRAALGTQPPPSAPTGLAAAASGGGIALSWMPPSSGTVTQYLVERCQGVGCTSFTQITTTGANRYSDSTVTPSMSYSYRVRAQDAAASLPSGYSNIASALAQSAPKGAIAFVQRNYAAPQSPQTVVSATYGGSQTAGNLNVVVVGWNDSAAQLESVTDTRGNVYNLAAGPSVNNGYITQAIYYAANIGAANASSNAVTATFDRPAAFVDLRIAEYAGIAAASPVAAVATGVGNSGSSATSALDTADASDLLVAANTVTTGTTGAAAGYTSRVITSPDSDILEDSVVAAAGGYGATASLAAPGPWVMQVVAFRGASGVSSPVPPPGAGPGTPPTISGSPPASVQIGQTYNFQPTASGGGSGGTLSFSIQNKPVWAAFSIATGALTGTPSAANAGSYAGISISVSNGTSSAALSPFTISVQAATSANSPPTISGTPATSITVGSAYV
ncbi:MAG: hypothetical protein ACREU6_03580, partial [Steroidobacteraceae bacterium]